MTVYLGNNLVSFPINDTVLISQAIPDVVEDALKGIIGQAIVAQNLFNNNNEFDEFWFGSLSALESKKGYWFQIEDDDIDYTTPISFLFEENNDLNRTTIEFDVRKNDFDYIQSIEQAFYFIKSIDGIDMEEGDWILSYNDFQLVGARQWLGNYTDVPAMGYYNVLTDKYCREGDVPDFYIYNNNTGKMIQLFGDIPEWSSNGIFNISLYIDEPKKAEEFIIKSVYPNPFNPILNIEYGLLKNSFINLAIYDINGRIIENIIKSDHLAGYYEIKWDATDQASGIYFIKLISEDGYSQVQKLILIK